MSVNFGYGGYGMTGGMNMMGMQGMNGSGGNTFESIASQYNCPACYQQGPVPYSYKTYVNPLPQEVVQPSFISRLIRNFMRG